MSDLRVLHVTTTGNIGGAERLIIDLASIRLPGVELAVCILGSGGALAAALATIGVRSYALDLRRGWQGPATIVRLAQLIRAHRTDVVHGHLIHGSAAATVAARLTRVHPAVFTRHYAMATRWYGTPTDRMLERAANGLTNRIFAISEAVRRSLIEEHVDPRRIEVVPNGIDAGRVRASVRSPDPRVRRGRPVLGTVASLQTRKGHADLLRAVAAVRAAGVDVDLVLIGDGPLASELHQLAADLRIADLVRFFGYEPAPYPAMAAFDMYVQPSVEEGFGIAVLEAMALGLPVVATRAGGLPEIVEDTRSGTLVDTHDPDGLARAILGLVRDPAARRRFGRRGADLVEERFESAKMATSYARAYVRLIGGATSARG